MTTIAWKGGILRPDVPLVLLIRLLCLNPKRDVLQRALLCLLDLTVRQNWLPLALD